MGANARLSMQKRNLAVGHFFNGPFKEACARHLPRIRETFFAWPGVLSCRPAPEFTAEVRARLVDDLKWARSNGIELDTLFNANCYGDEAGDLWAKVRDCRDANNCTHCGRCEELMRRVFK